MCEGPSNFNKKAQEQYKSMKEEEKRALITGKTELSWNKKSIKHEGKIIFNRIQKLVSQ